MVLLPPGLGIMVIPFTTAPASAEESREPADLAASLFSFRVVSDLSGAFGCGETVPVFHQNEFWGDE